MNNNIEAAKQTGKRVRSFREDAGLTQAALHEKANVPTNTIARLERGEHTATTPTLKKIASALGVTLNDLVD
jgi:transcriptional regulator with XRE-family HTH domain